MTKTEQWFKNEHEKSRQEFQVWLEGLVRGDYRKKRIKVDLSELIYENDIIEE